MLKLGGLLLDWGVINGSINLPLAGRPHRLIHFLVVLVLHLQLRLTHLGLLHKSLVLALVCIARIHLLSNSVRWLTFAGLFNRGRLQLLLVRIGCNVFHERSLLCILRLVYVLMLLFLSGRQVLVNLLVLRRLMQLGCLVLSIQIGVWVRIHCRIGFTVGRDA